MNKMRWSHLPLCNWDSSFIIETSLEMLENYQKKEANLLVFVIYYHHHC